jgi:CRISPR-associated protein Csb1
MPALRRLHFPVDGKADDQKRGRDAAGQTVLAALSLYAGALTIESGFDLRSRCLLWPTTASEWELLEKPGTPPKILSFSPGEALDVLKEAIKIAEHAGLEWKKEPIKLKPSSELVALLKRSQEIATATVEE